MSNEYIIMVFGDMEAQYILGLSYYRGEGVEAVYWLEQAANQGDADAQYYLGVSYANGEGVEKILSKPSIGTKKLLIRAMQMPKIILVYAMSLEKA